MLLYCAASTRLRMFLGDFVLQKEQEQEKEIQQVLSAKLFWLLLLVGLFFCCCCCVFVCSVQQAFQKKHVALAIALYKKQQ